MKFEIRGNPQVHIQESPSERNHFIVGVVLPITLRFNEEKTALKGLVDKMAIAMAKVVEEENIEKPEIIT